MTAILAGGIARAAAAASSRIRVGVLRYGTAAWELDVIARHRLAPVGLIDPVEYAVASAAQVALQADQVDVIVLDWLWVARQRASGADFTFVPFSNAVGALVAPSDSPVRAVGDLRGRRLGVAGSPLDKSWLILRAYARRIEGFDVDAEAQKSFGPPPLLAEQARVGRLDAVLTYWPFAARAEAAGMRRVLPVEKAVQVLGVGAGAPFIGHVFSERWAAANRAGLEQFIAAARAARGILRDSDAEWERLRPLVRPADDGELLALRNAYRDGIPERWGDAEREAAGRLFALLAEIGGPALVGQAEAIPAGTFWPVSWRSPR